MLVIMFEIKKIQMLIFKETFTSYVNDMKIA